MAGLLIVEVDDSVRADAELVRQLEDVCTVDLYSNAAGRVEIIEETSMSGHVRAVHPRRAAGTVRVKEPDDGSELSA